MAPFVHTVRFCLGMAMLAGGVVLAQPFAAAVVAARSGAETVDGIASAPPGMQVPGGAAMATAPAGHAIPDARLQGMSEGSHGPLANAEPFPTTVPAPVPPSPPTPLPASEIDLSPASPPLDGTYRSTVEIPPPPLLDVHAPPPLSAGWSVHDVAKPAAQSAAMQATASPAEYVVRDGDDLTGIAIRVYGHAGAANAIWTANQDRLADPQVLPIGLPLRLPPTWTLPASHGGHGAGSGLAIEPSFAGAQSSRRADAGVAADPGAPTAGHGAQAFWLQGVTVAPSAAHAGVTAAPGHRSSPEATTVSSVAERRPATVRVGPGDSLESIAVRFYGDRAMASRIWLANRDRLRSPDLLVPGAELRLP